MAEVRRADAKGAEAPRQIHRLATRKVGNGNRYLELLASSVTPVLGREISGTELELFGRYLHLLLQWNRVHGLVGLASPERIVRTLLVESLLFLDLLPSGPLSLVDVGSGAGFPGVPLRIVEPRLRVVLVESRRKRASFLVTAQRELGLGDMVVWHGRAEQLAQEVPNADAVTMKAVGGIERSLELGMPLLRPGGRLVATVSPSEQTGHVEPSPRVAGLAEDIQIVTVRRAELLRRFLIARSPNRPLK
jgi:16S rRNA (guanine527-N7)-methyltransferase